MVARSALVYANDMEIARIGREAKRVGENIPKIAKRASGLILKLLHASPNYRPDNYTEIQSVDDSGNDRRYHTGEAIGESLGATVHETEDEDIVEI